MINLQSLSYVFSWRHYKFVYLFWFFAMLDAALAITDLSYTIVMPEFLRQYIYIGQYQYFLSIYSLFTILCFLGIITAAVKTERIIIRCILIIHIVTCILFIDIFLQRVSDIIFAFGLK